MHERRQVLPGMKGLMHSFIQQNTQVVISQHPGVSLVQVGACRGSQLRLQPPGAHLLLGCQKRCPREVALVGAFSWIRAGGAPDTPPGRCDLTAFPGCGSRLLCLKCFPQRLWAQKGLACTCSCTTCRQSSWAVRLPASQRRP